MVSIVNAVRDLNRLRQINLVLLVSIGLIFMVTATLFESIRQPLVVLLAVPMALIGVFLGFFFLPQSGGQGSTGNDVRGVFVTYPARPSAGQSFNSTGSFLRSIVLVR